MIALNWIQLFFYFLFFNGVVLVPNMNMSFEENRFSVLSGILKHLMDCNHDNRRAIINCDTDKNLIKSFSDLESAVTIVLNCNLSAVNQLTITKRSSFIAAFDGSLHEIDRILHKFNQSPWWNVNSIFYILSGSKNGCSDGEQVLKIAWKLNILNCYFVCFDFTRKPFIFTFNPYSKYAPDPWKIVREITEKYDYMAIYNRPFTKRNICTSLSFDRTKYLDKAVLNVALCLPSSKSYLLPNLNEENHNLIYTHFEGDMLKLLKKGLKITLKYNYDVEPIEDPSKPRGVLIRLINKTTDVAMCLATHEIIFDLLPSHQIIYTGYTIFSKNRGLRSPLEKMYDFYGPMMITATVIISAITYFVIWYINKLRGHWFAIFEIFRLWTSTSLYSKIDSLALRIFFGVIFIYFLILQATFSGHLSKFLTNPELRHNAETLEDLKSRRYGKFCYSPPSRYLFVNDNILELKSTPTIFFKGIEAVLKNEMDAMIGIHFGFLVGFKRMKLAKDTFKNYYLSKNFIRDTYVLYALRHDWPLNEKFNNFIILLEDTGILLKLKNDLVSDLELLLMPIELNPEFKPIDLESLLFILYFLGIGLTTATFCFILERWQTKKHNFYSFNRNRAHMIEKRRRRECIISV
ncbi:uncharacterized protein LOC123262431 isoform X1 [Cotesia glomerata]|nr:uncharacterized protein LOC123262431 isoform X1 [Cotesia glomerata]